tara:strand:- start:55 stop:981 length:927 start_codon:yes stop_codon:yes gene_type:complete
MIKRVILIFTIFFTISVYAQQEPLFTQYYVNDMALNPAIAGSKVYNPLTIQNRQQWLGFEGAPFTSNISYHGTLDGRSALGGYLMFDQTYPAIQAHLQLNYAYHVPLDYKNVNISFGLGAKIKYYNLDFKQEDLPPGQDNAFDDKSFDKTLTDASSGVYFYGKNFYSGFSVSNMFQASFNPHIQNSPYFNSEYRKYYGIGAYRLGIINNDWHIEPSFLIRKMQYQPSIVDFSTRIFYLDDTWTGLTYRNNGTVILGLGFAANNLHVSYSYDHNFQGDMMQYSYGTHEIGITIRFKTLASQRHIGFWPY